MRTPKCDGVDGSKWSALGARKKEGKEKERKEI
jgi:hypothetical protein